MVADRPTPLRGRPTHRLGTDRLGGEAPDSEVLGSIRKDLDEWMRRLDVREFVTELERFGRERPIPMVFAALTVGVASGLLMRRATSRERRST